MYYLNFNIEKVQTALMSYVAIQKIATMRASNGEMGESSIGGIISVRIFQPDYHLSIEYSQSGTYDDYKETDRLALTFGRVSIWDSLDDISGPDDDGRYFDSYNQEKMSWDDLVDLVASNSLYKQTERDIQSYISQFKEEAEKCSHCGNNDIKKRGKETHADGDHQRFQCKVCRHYFTSEWTL